MKIKETNKVLVNFLALLNLPLTLNFSNLWALFPPASHPFIALNFSHTLSWSLRPSLYCLSFLFFFHFFFSISTHLSLLSWPNLHCCPYCMYCFCSLLWTLPNVSVCTLPISGVKTFPWIILWNSHVLNVHNKCTVRWYLYCTLFSIWFTGGTQHSILFIFLWLLLTHIIAYS